MSRLHPDHFDDPHPGDDRYIKGSATAKTMGEAQQAFLQMRRQHDWKIVGEKDHGSVYSLHLERMETEMVEDECTRNGQAGRCGSECSMYQWGNCHIQDEIAEIVGDPPPEKPLTKEQRFPLFQSW